MQIEPGKFYVTRSGQTIGPANSQPHSAQYPWHFVGAGSYSNDGRFNGEFDDPKDLMREAVIETGCPPAVEDYQRGWDDCYRAMQKALGEHFTLPVTK